MDMQTLMDRAEISDLVKLYCRGVDRRDEATLRAIYHDDAIDDRGEGMFIGRAQDWVGWAMDALRDVVATQHCVMNILIDVEGDVAHGETYFIAYHRIEGGGDDSAAKMLDVQGVSDDDVVWPEGGTEFVLGGRYLDRFERRDGVWKIAYRRMLNDWCRTQPLAQDFFAENPTIYHSVRQIDDARLDSALHPRKTL